MHAPFHFRRNMTLFSDKIFRSVIDATPTSTFCCSLYWTSYEVQRRKQGRRYLLYRTKKQVKVISLCCLKASFTPFNNNMKKSVNEDGEYIALQHDILRSQGETWLLNLHGWNDRNQSVRKFILIAPSQAHFTILSYN